MNKKELTDKIIAIEEEMFMATPNEGGVASCQKTPKTFRLMRAMQHLPHGEEFLLSYLDDLEAAKASDRNFMIEKYARMDNLIPPINENPLIAKIAEREAGFLEEAASQNPRIQRREEPGRFKKYISCELETLSDKSLALYAEELEKAMLVGENPALARFAWLEKKLA